MKWKRVLPPQAVLVSFFLLCFLETTACLIWLVRIPADPENAELGGLSLQRLTVLSVMMVWILLFLALGLLASRKPETCNRFAESLRVSRLVGPVSSLLALGSILSAILLVVPPPALLPLASALHQRISPLLLSLLLVQGQALVAIALLAPQRVEAWNDAAIRRIRAVALSSTTAYGLLVLSALVSASQVFYLYYNSGDEGDTLAVGWLVSKGWVLYRDVFSHHFPFPYLWVAMVVKLFGPTVLPARLSLILLRTAVFFIAMKLTRFRLALGLTALAWSLVGHLYLANALLYHSFSSVFLLGAAAIGLAAMADSQTARRSTLFTMGAFCGLAGLSDPLKFLPALALMAFVILAALLRTPRQAAVSRGCLATLILLAGFASAVGSYLLYGALTRSLPDFYQNAIQFNATTYSKYTPPVTMQAWSGILTSGLGIADPAWRRYFSPFYEWNSFEFLDNWLFSGFFYRLVILITCGLFLLRRKIIEAMAIYATASLTMLRGSMYFHSAPLVLLSLFMAASLISGDAFSLHGPFETSRAGLLRTGRAAIWVVVTLMFGWLSLRAANVLLKSPDKLTYDSNFGGAAGDAAYYRSLTCDRDDARLLVYPLDPIVYFLSQIPPSSKYLFMTPWTAEIGQRDAIGALDNHPTILFIDRTSSVWNYPVSQYLSELLRYVDDHYVPAGEEHVYISPRLLPCK